MTQVFISYSRKNLDFVERLASDLQAEGLDVWYDLSHLEGGMQWAPEIQSAIQQSQYFIFVLSPDSVNSTWVQREYLYAEKLKLNIIPLMLQECDIPLWSMHLQYIDIQGKKYDLQFAELRKVLNIEQRIATKNKLDCVILCGGYSQRLWPLTIDISKVLLPVAGKPALEHVVNFVQESPDIHKIILSVNQKFASQIDNFVNDYESQGQPRHPIEVIVEPSTQQKEKLGPVGALQYIVSQSEPRDLLVIGGDNIFGSRLDDFLSFIHKTGEFLSCITVYDHRDSTQDKSKYGLVDRDDAGRVRRLIEKPQKATLNYISAACYFFKKRDVEAIQDYILAGEDPDSLGDFVSWLIRQSRIMSFMLPSFWFDVGTPEVLLKANRHFLAHSISRDATLSETECVEPVRIDANSEVSNSKLGPNVYIGPGVQVIDSTIRDSIIMEQCEIRACDIKNSLIGPGCVIENLPMDGWIFGPKSKVSK